MGDNSNIINKIKQAFHSTSKPSALLTGLDIDPSSLLVVEMAGQPQTPKIKGVAASIVPSGTIIEEQIQNPAALKESLIQLKQQFPKMTGAVAICSPGRFIVLKEVNIPANLSNTQLKRVAWQQAKKAFPGLIDDLYLDYTALEEPDTKVASLLIIAARKKELDARIEAIQGADINTKIIDIDRYVLERAYPLIAEQLPESHVDHYTGLLNIDTQRIILSIIHKKNIVYCHQRSYHGENFAPWVQALLDLETESQTHQWTSDQENLLINNGQQLLQAFLSEKPGVHLSHLMLSGRCALIPNIGRLFQERLGVKTSLADPFANTKFAPSINATKLVQQAPAYLLACGLALRGL